VRAVQAVPGEPACRWRHDANELRRLRVYGRGYAGADGAGRVPAEGSSRAPAGGDGADRRDAGRAEHGLQLLRPRSRAAQSWHAADPRSHQSGEDGWPQLCLSRLLGERLTEDGLQGPLPSARGPAGAARLAAPRLTPPRAFELDPACAS